MFKIVFIICALGTKTESMCNVALTYQSSPRLSAILSLFTNTPHPPSHCHSQLRKNTVAMVTGDRLSESFTP